METPNKQRLAIKGIAVLVVRQCVKYYRSLLPLLVLVGFRDGSKLFLFGGLSVLLILSSALWNYWFTYYFVENEEFVLSKGGFSRDETRIPLDRIESINLAQPPTQQLLGLTKLQINSLGSEKSEVDLLALDSRVAKELQAFLQSKRSESTSQEMQENDLQEVVPAPTPYFSVSLKALLLHGVLAPNFRFLISALTAGYFLLDDVLAFFGIEDSVLDVVKEGSAQIPVYVFIGFAVVLFGMNIVGQALTYWMQNLRIREDFWELRYGLLKKEERTLGVSKIQILKSVQNPLQKKYGQISLKILSPEVKRSLKIPVLSPKEKEGLIPLWENAFSDKHPELHANWRYMLPSLYAAIAVAGFAFYFQIYALLVLAAYFLLYGMVAFRRHRLIPTEKGLIIQHGFWNRTQIYIPNKKIQSMRLRQAFWHERSDLAYVSVHTAVSSFQFGPCSQQALLQLMQTQMHTLEKNNAAWA